MSAESLHGILSLFNQKPTDEKSNKINSNNLNKTKSKSSKESSKYSTQKQTLKTKDEL
jgi:hypothetical protein